MNNRTIVLLLIVILVVAVVWATDSLREKREVAPTGPPPLIMAAIMGDADSAKQLLADGADVNGCAPGTNWTALHAAASDGRTAVARLLLEHGADINRQSDNGNTPLHLAALWERYQTTKLLLASGADVSIRNDKGETPQELATTEEMAALFEEPAAQE